MQLRYTARKVPCSNFFWNQKELNKNYYPQSVNYCFWYWGWSPKTQRLIQHCFSLSEQTVLWALLGSSQKIAKNLCINNCNLFVFNVDLRHTYSSFSQTFFKRKFFQIWCEWENPNQRTKNIFTIFQGLAYSI
jgi:hypothetical protein